MRWPYVVVLAAAGCNTAPFTPSTPPDCSKTECSCEQDPTQPTCKGLPGLPEGGLPTPLDGGGPVLEDAGLTDAGDEDAASDAGEDAGEDEDAGDEDAGE